MPRLTKKEIKVVNARVLNSRFCRLMEKGETLPASEFTVAEARELLWIEDELHERLIKLVGHDFYPPDRVEEKELPSNSIAAVLGRNKLEVKTDAKIKFPVTVYNSMGTKVAEFPVEADTKIEADKLARREIRKLRLERVTHKLN